jgi:hypothetical protein
MTANLLNQIGLVLGFCGSLLLAVSAKVGVLGRDGAVIFTGLDPMAPPDENIRKVRASHWRNKYLSPTGWGLLMIAFLVQFLATLIT